MSSPEDLRVSQQRQDTQPVPPSKPITISFESLSAGSDEVIIHHQGQDYRLRRTRNGGLILNK